MHRIAGGVGALLPWLPIKAYRPCPAFVEAKYKYSRQGQSLDEVGVRGNWSNRYRISAVSSSNIPRKYTRNTRQAKHVFPARRVLRTVLLEYYYFKKTGNLFNTRIPKDLTFVATIVFILQHALLVVQVVFARREEVLIPDMTLDSVDDDQETNVASIDGAETENAPDKDSKE